MTTRADARSPRELIVSGRPGRPRYATTAGVESRAPATRPRPATHREMAADGLLDRFRAQSCSATSMDQLAIEPRPLLNSALAELRGALGDGVEHGLESVGELRSPAGSRGRRLLLERLGEVAVAGLELLEQPHVLDGDDGLVGEGLEQRDLRVGERPAPRRQTDRSPRSARPPRSMGTASERRDARPRAAIASPPDRSARDVEDRGRPCRSGSRAAAMPTAVGRGASRSARRDADVSSDVLGVATRHESTTHRRSDRRDSVRRVAQPHGASHDRVEDRLNVGRRARDHPRISLVAVCCSSASRQLAVARLQLGEQPHVLDGDDRLVGEGLEKRDCVPPKTVRKSPISED